MLLSRPELFLYKYVRKEAVLSSQIEGTQSTLSDLLRFETKAEGGQPIDDIREVSNYVDAMMYGLERLAELPLSLRLIREIHARLLRSGRGETTNPGEFRRTQNWVGGPDPATHCSYPRLSWSWMPAWISLNALFMKTPHNSLRLLKRAFFMFSLKLFIRFWTVMVASAVSL